jgi:general secretion pathway protein G
MADADGIARATQRCGPIRAHRRRGYTLVELMMTVALLGVLASVAIAKYLGYVEKARVAHAIAEIRGISQSLDALRALDASSLPDSLAYVDAATLLDPWGRPYKYLKLAGDLPPGMSEIGVDLPPVAASGGGGPPGGGPPAGGEGGGGPPAIALARKDRFLVPINSDYDLYSMGADGESRPQLHNAVSRDDVIRARDGAYVGLAESF